MIDRVCKCGHIIDITKEGWSTTALTDEITGMIESIEYMCQGCCDIKYHPINNNIGGQNESEQGVKVR